MKLIKYIRYDWPMHIVLLLTAFLPDNVIFLKLRGFLASPFFANAGKNLRLGRGLVFYQPSNIEIGDNVYIAYGNWFGAMEKISIGDDTIFGPKSNIVASNHSRERGTFNGKPNFKPIIIGSGCWIAGNCTITAGSVIGNGTLIAANSVVRGQVPENVLFGGVPGKVIKHYSEDD